MLLWPYNTHTQLRELVNGNEQLQAARHLLNQVAAYPHPKMERLEKEVLKHFAAASASEWCDKDGCARNDTELAVHTRAAKRKGHFAASASEFCDKDRFGKVDTELAVHTRAVTEKAI